MTLLKAYLRGEYENPFVLSKAYLDTIQKDIAAAEEKLLSDYGMNYKEWKDIVAVGRTSNKTITQLLASYEKDMKELSDTMFDAFGVQYVRWTKEELDKLDEDDRENYEVGDIKTDKDGANITEGIQQPLSEPILVFGETLSEWPEWIEMRNDTYDSIKSWRKKLKELNKDQAIKDRILEEAKPKNMRLAIGATKVERKEVRIKMLELGLQFLKDRKEELELVDDVSNETKQALQFRINEYEESIASGEKPSKEERAAYNNNKSHIRDAKDAVRNKNIEIKNIKQRIRRTESELETLNVKIDRTESIEETADELTDIREEERRQTKETTLEEIAEEESIEESKGTNTYADWEQWFTTLAAVPKQRIKQTSLRRNLTEFFDNLPPQMLSEFKDVKPISTPKSEYGLGTYNEKTGGFNRTHKDVLVPNLEALKRIWETVQNKPVVGDENEENWAEKQAISRRILDQINPLIAERRSKETKKVGAQFDEEKDLDIQGINLILEDIKEKHEAMPGDEYKVMNIDAAQQLLGEINTEMLNLIIKADEKGRITYDDLKQLYLSVAAFREKFNEEDFPYYHELSHSLQEAIKDFEKKLHSKSALLDEEDYEKLKREVYTELKRPIGEKQSSKNKKEFIQIRINVLEDIVDNIQSPWKEGTLRSYVDVRFPTFKRKKDDKLESSQQLDNARDVIINNIVNKRPIQHNHLRPLLGRNVKIAGLESKQKVSQEERDVGEWEEDETEEEREGRQEGGWEGAREAGYGGGDIFGELAQQRQQEAREEEIREKFEDEDEPDDETKEQRLERYEKFKEQELEEMPKEEEAIQRHKIKEQEKRVAPKREPGKTPMDYEMRRRMEEEE